MLITRTLKAAPAATASPAATPPARRTVRTPAEHAPSKPTNPAPRYATHLV